VRCDANKQYSGFIVPFKLQKQPTAIYTTRTSILNTSQYSATPSGWFMFFDYYTSCDNFVRTLPPTLAIMLHYRISRSPVKTYVIRQRVATGFSLAVAG
jgi:hypothetical protein